MVVEPLDPPELDPPELDPPELEPLEPFVSDPLEPLVDEPVPCVERFVRLCVRVLFVDAPLSFVVEPVSLPIVSELDEPPVDDPPIDEPLDPLDDPPVDPLDDPLDDDPP